MVPARAATCWASPRRAAATLAVSVSSVSSRTNRPGCSDWAERTSPHTAAAAGSGSSSVPQLTARRVTIASLESENRSSASQSWTSRSARRTASRAAAARSGSSSGTSRAMTSSGVVVSAVRSPSGSSTAYRGASSVDAG